MAAHGQEPTNLVRSAAMKSDRAVMEAELALRQKLATRDVLQPDQARYTHWLLAVRTGLPMGSAARSESAFDFFPLLSNSADRRCNTATQAYL